MRFMAPAVWKRHRDEPKTLFFVYAKMFMIITARKSLHRLPAAETAIAPITVGLLISARCACSRVTPRRHDLEDSVQYF